MTPMTPPNPPSGNDKVKRIVISVLCLIMTGYLISGAISRFQARQKAMDSPGQSAPP